MVDNKKHCQSCLQKYGIDGKDIHDWMDEPSYVYREKHRHFRHNLKQEIPICFINKYGKELSRNVILDHIILDSKIKNGIVNEFTSLDDIIQEILCRPLSETEPIEEDIVIGDEEMISDYKTINYENAVERWMQLNPMVPIDNE